ncbi:MAG: hypothetical protein Q7R96_02915 [Nanoarchaeota archaeon]|nr:hypothetical protein [Nanoarchaeota archaeon]
MFKKYGLIGILLILFVELNFLLKLQPFAKVYFQLVWIGYILVIDALVYKIKKRSLLMNNRKGFFLLALLSIIFWWTFELINHYVGNWSYGTPGGMTGLGLNLWRASIAFATVLPAIVETLHLLESLQTFKHIHSHKQHHLTKKIIYCSIVSGIISFALVFILPEIAFPLLWLGFFLILDPINYLHGVPSILKHFEQGNWRFILLLGLAGLICGFFWEFWNYWSINKWYYTIPYVGFFKIFEMPLLGYLGYPPFALEIYAMWHFMKSLHLKK